jgi:hypothetical protein
MPRQYGVPLSFPEAINQVDEEEALLNELRAQMLLQGGGEPAQDEIELILDWSQCLDFDDYFANWLTLGTSAPTGLVQKISALVGVSRDKESICRVTALENMKRPSIQNYY